MNDITCDAVLDGAKQADLREVLVIGIQQDGELHIAGSGSLDIGEALILMERAKRRLIDIYEEGLEGPLENQRA